MKIGLDIDGVIIDFERTMRTYAELYDLFVLRKDGTKYYREFDYLKRYDWTVGERKKFIEDYLVYATKNSTSLIPLVKEMLELFKIEGHRIILITARGLLKEETKDAVRYVFLKNNIPVDNIYWGVQDKASICKKLNVDIMIDDNPPTCKTLSDNKVMTLYFRDKDSEIIPNNDYLKEVSNVGEICRYIISISGFHHSKEEYEKILKHKK